MLKIEFSNRFQKEIKLMKKRGKDLSKFIEVMQFLEQNAQLPQKYKDHKLKGEFDGFRDCHIEPDWILIYRIHESSVFFERTGTHSDLFKK